MKRLCSFCLVCLLLLGTAAPASALGFQDVPAASSLSAEIEKAAEYGLMHGYSSTVFGYADPVTRVQFVTVLGRMLGWFEGCLPHGSHITSAMSVPNTLNWAYLSAIDLAAEHDVIDTDTAFRPSDAITRAEMAEMLVRAMGLKSAAAIAEKENHFPFTDVTEGRGYIAVAHAAGMTNGTTATTFSPFARATRGQAAAMMVRIYEKYNHSTDWVHGFYAISSYGQISLTGQMDAVSAGWSRMTWDGTSAVLSTTSAGSNEYYIPGGYDSATTYLESNGTPLNLSVFMDSSVSLGTGSALGALLDSASGRSQAIAQIINELSISYQSIGKNPYSGVTVDFEGLRSGSKSSFNAFLSELAPQVKALGKSLYVCVSPVLTTGSYYDGYDYKTIGNLADKVILMAYDYDTRDLSGYIGTEYYKTAAPTPVGQIYESLRAITDFDTGVQDRSKIVMGFSCKNVAWQIDSSGKLLSGTPVYPSNDTVSRRLAQSGTVTGWSAEYQSSYAVYQTEKGETYFLWYESGDSVQATLKLAKLFDVDSVSLWRLGTIPEFSGWSWSDLLK